MINTIKNFGRQIKLKLWMDKYNIKRTDMDDMICLQLVEDCSFECPFIVANKLFYIPKQATETENKHRIYEFLYYLINEHEGYLKYYKPKEGDVVIDAGAYYGFFAILISKQIGESGKIICMEPDQANFEMMKKYLEANNCKNVIPLQAALWKEKGEIAFHSLASQVSQVDFTNNASVKIYGEQNRVKKNSVRALALQDVMIELQLTNVTFIKMDIESSEVEAVQGCLELKNSYNTSYAIACYHVRNNQRTSYIIEEIFRDAGYFVEVGYPQHLMVWAWIEDEMPGV